MVKDGLAYQIEVPARAKIYFGARCGLWRVHFDQIFLDGVPYLAHHVLDMARKEENGFRVVRLLPMDKGCPPDVIWITDL
jgi:hypothetical protein